MANPRKTRRVSDDALEAVLVLVKHQALRGVTVPQAELLKEVELFVKIEQYRRAEAAFVQAHYAEEKKTRRYQGRVIMDEARALWRAEHPRP